MKKEDLVSNLNNLSKYPNDDKYNKELYSHLVDMVWWNDNRIMNDDERKIYLYEVFIQYYNLISNGEIKEIEKDSSKAKELRYSLINLCKMQLDFELDKI